MRALFALPLLVIALLSADETQPWRIWEMHEPQFYFGGSGFMNDNPVSRSVTYEPITIGSDDIIFNILYKTTAAAFGYQVFTGMQINPVVAVEFKFMQTLAPFEFYVNTFYNPDDLSIGGNLYFKIKQIVFGPTTLIHLPISKYFTPYFKGGAYTFYWMRHRHYDETRNAPTVQPMHSDYWAIRVALGYGIKSQISKHFGLRLEYECPTNPIIDTQLKLLEGNLNLAGYFTF